MSLELKSYGVAVDLFLWKTMFKTMKTQENSNYFERTDLREVRREKREPLFFLQSFLKSQFSYGKMGDRKKRRGTYENFYQRPLCPAAHDRCGGP